jgi:predicted PurR-regulated permease PerM
MEQDAMTSPPANQPATAGPPPDRLRFDLLNVAAATAIVLLVVKAFTFIDLIRQVLLLLILAILLATSIQPLVARLRRSGVSRGPSVLGIYVVVVAVVAGFLVAVGSAIAAQASALVTDLPGLSERLGLVVASLPAGPIRDIASTASSSLSPAQIGPLLSSIFTTGTLASLVFVTVTIFETAFTVVTIFVLAYFWIAERMAIRRLLVQAVSFEHRLRAFSIWESVEQKLGAWIRGQLLLMLIIGVAQGIGYVVLGVPFALLLAVFAALAEAVPMVGPYLGAVPAILVALTVSPTLALILVAYTVVLHLVESNVLVPRIMQNAVGLTPLTVVLALLVGAAVGGIIGAVLAIPIAAVIQDAVSELVRAPVASPASQPDATATSSQAQNQA